MISPDDPRLTAHADGMLPADEAARVERELAYSPSARAELERLRELQRALRQAFAEETAEDGVLAADGEAAEASRPAAGLAGDRPSGSAGARAADPGERRRRPYSIYRDALQAREEAAGWRPLEPEPARGGRFSWLSWLFPGWLAPVAGFACVVLLVAAVVLPPVVRVRETARIAAGTEHLTRIGRAMLGLAAERDGRLPEASDLRDLARRLAQEAGLDDAAVWTSPGDPAVAGWSPGSVLAPDGEGLAADFAVSPLSWTVVIGGLDPAAAGPRTPIAWTRGLRPDGTWPAYGPNGTQGGHVLFFDGTVGYFGDLRGRLAASRDGSKTGDVRAALPEGVRIGEFVGSADERLAWTRVYRPGPDDSLFTKARHSRGFVVGMVLVWICGAGGLVGHLLRRRPGEAAGGR